MYIASPSGRPKKKRGLVRLASLLLYDVLSNRTHSDMHSHGGGRPGFSGPRPSMPGPGPRPSMPGPRPPMPGPRPPMPGPGPWSRPGGYYPFPGPRGPYFPAPTYGYNPFPLPYSLNYPYVYPTSTVVVGVNPGASLGDVCYSNNVLGTGSSCGLGTTCAPTNLVTDAVGRTFYQGQCRLSDNVVLY